MINTQHGAKATGDKWRDRYRTPRYILDRVNSTFGEGWYDPCPGDRGPDLFDGLISKWGKKSFINPPFSEYLRWVEKGLQELQIEPDCEQIWILHHDSSTEKFKRLAQESSAICLLSKRVSFIPPIPFRHKGDSDIAKSQTIIYIGNRVDAFDEAFTDLGMVVFKK